MRIKKCAVFLLILILVLSGCAINNKTFGTRNKAFEEGQQLIQSGQLELGLIRLEQAAEEEPNNKEIRAVLMRQRDAVLGQLLADANNTRLSGDLDLAEEKYYRILDLFPRNERAQTGLDEINRNRQHIASVEYAQQLLALDDLDGAENAVRAVLQENSMQPQAREFLKTLNKRIARAESMDLTLETAFKKPLSMEFKDTELKSVFEIMSRTAGVNFVFDKDVRQDTKVSVFVRDNTVEDILKLLLMTNQLAYTRLNDNSLMIYPNTPAKQKEYQELVVRSFPVAYGDVKQMVAMVRGLVKAKDIYVNEQLNLFIMRDTLEAIRMVEKLVSLNDLPEPEVMLEVMILTVNRENNFLLGPRFPQSTTFSFVPGVGPAGIEGNAAAGIVKLSEINRSGFPNLRNFTIANQVVVDFMHNLSMGDVLANPRVRVKNREAAKFHIGTRQPIFSASVAGGGISNVVTSTPTFIDVGTKLDIEPIIGLSNEVSMKVQLEVSSIVGEVEGPASAGGTGPKAPIITTTNAETLLTLKDGETEVLAGLLEDNESRSVSGLAGLINIPGLDRLTSGQKVDRIKREVILLITPRIIRNISQQTNLESEFHFGTSNEPGKLPVRIRKTSAGALAMAPVGAGGRGGASLLSRGAQALSADRSEISPNPFAQQAAANGEPTLSIQAPSNITFDKEFAVRVRMVGARASVSGEAQVSYDTGMLELLNSDENSGTHTVKFGKDEPTGMAAQLRFKVITPNAGETEISVQSATGEDKESGESVEIALPTPATVKIQ
ncbi:MAG: secretin and TonB N-terminal domain-containing protein [Burkholderiales bacterium]|nr:secretin and TonB N-terminal domain-containing protein [Nitrosomonas sp.]MCP5274770.1 secretin and TonB N-terminal domain-containing protein [Burkholderiales bacterium]